MADRSLRGTGLGAKSFEDEAGVEFAARQEVGYDCPRDHHFSLVFAAEADIPSVWECPRCGAESLRADGERPELKEEKPARTHWDMLRERRSIAELEDLLAERLNQLRSVSSARPHSPATHDRRRPPKSFAARAAFSLRAAVPRSAAQRTRGRPFERLCRLSARFVGTRLLSRLLDLPCDDHGALRLLSIRRRRLN